MGMSDESIDKMAEEGIPNAKERIDKMKEAEARDVEDARKLAEIDESMKRMIGAFAGILKDIASISDAVKDGDKSLEKADTAVETSKEKEEEIKKEREGRFSIIELIRLLKAFDGVTESLSADESKELAKIEEEKLELADGWSGTKDIDKETKDASRKKMSGEGETGKLRRTVVIHPKPDSLENKERYNRAYESVKNYVSAMRSVFRLRMGTRHHVESELLEGKLHRKMLGKAMITDRLFYTETEKKAEGLDLCILLDESGSMGSADHSSRTYMTRAWSALITAVAMAEALKGVSGINLEAYSHTSTGSLHQDCLIKVLKDVNSKTLMGIGGYCHGAQNYDHVAIREVGNRFAKNTPNKKKVMFVVSDGEPAGHNYYGLS